MSKSFSIRKFDEQGLARLNNEIKLLWNAVEKGPTEEVKKVAVDVAEITAIGYEKLSTRFLGEDGYFDSVKDSDLDFADITTNDATTAKHGFVPKLPNDSTKFYNGLGDYTVPPNASGAASVADSKAESGVTKAGSQNTAQSTDISSVDAEHDSKDNSQSTLISNLDSRLLSHGI